MARWKEKIPRKQKEKIFFYKKAFLIQFSWIVVGPYCSLSGLVLCMLFYRRTYNQYYFNYSSKFLLIKHFLLCFTFFPTFQPSIDVLRLFSILRQSHQRSPLFILPSLSVGNHRRMFRCSNWIAFMRQENPLQYTLLSGNKHVIEAFQGPPDIGYFMQPATQTDTTSTCTISDDFIKIYFVAFFTSLTDPIPFLINQIVITMITIWYPCRGLLCTREFKSLLTLINSDNWI